MKNLENSTIKVSFKKHIKVSEGSKKHYKMEELINFPTKPTHARTTNKRTSRIIDFPPKL